VDQKLRSYLLLLAVLGATRAASPSRPLQSNREVFIDHFRLAQQELHHLPPLSLLLLLLLRLLLLRLRATSTATRAVAGGSLALPQPLQDLRNAPPVLLRF
jgi:hypothetical protein